MIGPVTVAIVSPNAGALLGAGYNRIRVWRSTTIDGTYAEITSVSTRPFLFNVPAQTYVDAGGQAGNYYKWSFLRTSDGAETALSDPTLGDGEPAFDVITVDELMEEFLFGIDFRDKKGNTLSDRAIGNAIKAAVTEVEQRLDIIVGLKQFTDERVDYIRSEYEEFLFMKVVNAPLVAVTSLQLVLPTNQPVVTYDSSWIFPNQASGQIQVVPGTGQILLGQASWLALTIGHGRYIPDAFRVSYLAGFPKGAIPNDIRQLVGKIASILPLHLVGDMVHGLGVAARSTTIDGVTTSIQTTQSHQDAAFSARIRELRQEIDATVKQLRVNYKGVPMWVA